MSDQTWHLISILSVLAAVCKCNCKQCMYILDDCDSDSQCIEYLPRFTTFFIWLVCGISTGLAGNIVIIITVDVQKDLRCVLFTLYHTLSTLTMYI